MATSTPGWLAQLYQSHCVFIVLASRGAGQSSVTGTLGECLHHCNKVIVYLLC